MASFKSYIHFMFWKGALLRGRSPHLGHMDSTANDPMTGFIQIKSLKQLPPDDGPWHKPYFRQRLCQSGN